MPSGTQIVDHQHLRRRNVGKDTLREPTVSTEDTSYRKVRKPVPFRSGAGTFASLIFCTLLPFILSYAVTIYSKSRLPQDRHKNGSALSPFKKDNAMRHIQRIGQKPRFVTTAALEESLQYILAELQKLKLPAAQHGMELDVHMFRSEADTFSTSVGNVNLVNSYDKMSSIVARLRPAALENNSTEKSLLINAHVDSAIGAPGVNDDVVGVGIMMEIVRCIAEETNRDKLLKRPIIFLFNGGEEVVLPASHSFITQHPWAQTIAAHINMESIGSGDSYHLFRLGPGSSWLAEAYAKAVSVPSGTVTGTDVFNARIIPAETDFRIFDEVGNIPGFDFVLLDNGYIYHTTYDNLDNIDEVGVCHGGDMVYELTMELAGPNDSIGKRDDVVKPRYLKRWYDALCTLSLHMGLVRDRSNPRVTFFDLLHMKTVVYEEGVAALFNIFVVVTSAVVWSVKISSMSKKDAQGIFRMFLVLAACIVGGAGSSTFTSFIYAEVLGAKLRWYGNWMTALVIFGPPASFGVVTALLVFLPRYLSVYRFDQMLFAVSTIYALLSVAFTRYGIMSSYLPTALLLMSSICAVQGPRIHPIVRHAQLISVHAVLGAKLTATSFSSILPLLGRLKSSVVPHDTIAAFVVTLLMLADGVLSSLPILCHYCLHLRKLRAVLFFLSIGIAASLLGVRPRITGRPFHLTYSSDAPKRISAIHFFSPQQDPPSVLWLGSQDAVPLNQQRILSKLSSTEETGVVSEMPTWGSLRSTALETFRPFGVFFQEVVAVPVDSLPNLPLPTASVVHEDELPEGWNITVNVQAHESHLLTVRLRTGPKSVVKNWSINGELFDHEDGAWVKHTGTPDFQFWLLLKKSSHSLQRPNVSIALSSGRLGFSRSPKVLTRLSFEKWETPSVAVSTGREVVL